MYFNMTSYTRYYPIEAFNDEGAYVEIPEDEISLKAENIVPTDFNSSEVKNASRDMNETRENNTSHERTYTQEEIAAQYKEIEKQMYDDAGGKATREEILAEMERRKAEENKQENTKPSTNESNSNSYNESGNVMVKWDVNGREPHQNNDWYIRNPGYKCGKGANGKVTIFVKVGYDGRITHAEFVENQSYSVNECMKSEALMYAKMSRFKPSANGQKSQEGYIYYTFVAQ